MYKSLTLLAATFGTTMAVAQANASPSPFIPVAESTPALATEQAELPVNESSSTVLSTLTTDTAAAPGVQTIVSTIIENKAGENTTLVVDTATAPAEASSTGSPRPKSDAQQEQLSFGAALLAGVVMGLTFL
ncbi:hypothetical protein BU24DRAFT_413712 [Aaosphaeria arxii CBS 175.79]|uniref:Uncharacterized protein n=1 Tax=Aaosphaeria arxii CBS 175.79 TaxID=1450172 RepID=A0A6A5XDX0_9PLEO|nr:uncharacterized protein BU24DRAFT_413712 [Aaosphaeria arxii CBS 175.79]KAF2011026.1 hypothetical protein BU24DRAFT_413712 [Aaosphaeria arxii CBS 175.79]